MASTPSSYRVKTIAPSALSALDIVVLYSGFESTLKALRTAEQLAQGLALRIRLVRVQCVPYPLPLEASPVDQEHLDRSCRTLAARFSASANLPVETAAEVWHCRDRAQALLARLAPRSIVVVGRASRWSALSSFFLARRLARAGHLVVRAS